MVADMGTSAVRGLAESLSAYIGFNNKMRFNRQLSDRNLFDREHLYLSGSDASSIILANGVINE